MHQIELNCYVRENLSARKCQIGLDERKFSSAKKSTFTVFGIERKVCVKIHVSPLALLIYISKKC